MKIAIVTGASSGLGREFVRQITRLYKNLDEIWVVARRAERLEELKEKLPVYIRVFAGDMEEDLMNYLVYSMDSHVLHVVLFVELYFLLQEDNNEL